MLTDGLHGRQSSPTTLIQWPWTRIQSGGVEWRGRAIQRVRRFICARAVCFALLFTMTRPASCDVLRLHSQRRMGTRKTKSSNCIESTAQNKLVASTRRTWNLPNPILSSARSAVHEVSCICRCETGGTQNRFRWGQVRGEYQSCLAAVAPVWQSVDRREQCQHLQCHWR